MIEEQDLTKLTDQQLRNLDEQDKNRLYSLLFDRNYGVYSKRDMDKIRDGRVLVVGQGCVGQISTHGLTRTGFGLVTVADFDALDITNLNRLVTEIYEDIGKPKVANITRFIKKALPVYRDDMNFLRLIGLHCMLDEKNIESVFRGDEVRTKYGISPRENRQSIYDVIIGAIDRMDSRILSARAARELGIPYVAISGSPPLRAYVTVFRSDGIDYETALGFKEMTDGKLSDHPRRKELAQQYKDERAAYAGTHGADRGWHEDWRRGRRRWGVTFQRPYIEAILAVNEAIKIVLGRKEVVFAPDVIDIDLYGLNPSSATSVPLIEIRRNKLDGSRKLYREY